MIKENKTQHQSVLLKESVSPFLENRGNVYVDCTFGGGGHTAHLLQAKPDAIVYAVDRDISVLEKGRQRFSQEIESGRLILLQGNYGSLVELLQKQGLHTVDGILVDAGVSSFQIDMPERGFSFLRNGPLDMRMDQGQSFTAYELVNRWSRSQLEKILYEFGEEKFARKITARILEKRELAPIEDTATLANLVENCLPMAKGKRQGIHPATRTFQAIRIAVNGELEGLRLLLQSIPDLLNPGGVFSAISFHSLEDRMVKERLRYLTAGCICPPEVFSCQRCGNPPGFLLQKKPVIPSVEEMEQNPRSRSAKLRVFVKAPENRKE